MNTLACINVLKISVTFSRTYIVYFLYGSQELSGADLGVIIVKGIFGNGHWMWFRMVLNSDLAAMGRQ